ncbi:MAG: FAD binding domain-containing protein [Anaerolineaceae bacterium]|nr:FAD binding domain-containing protein [Anaerolineaceae bacterium]
MTDYQYLEPKTIQQALEILADYGGEARVLAGGTDLILDVQHHRQQPGNIVSINLIEELQHIVLTGDELRIGAGVTFARLSSSPLVIQHCQMLAEGAGCVGSVQIRNVATVGGNICNALPCADSAAPLAAASAQVVLASLDGARHMPVVEFIQGPRKTLLKPGELLVEFIIPVKPACSGSAYKVTTTRKALDLTIAGVAAGLMIDPADKMVLDAGIALANSSPAPLRAAEAEAHLKAKPFSESLIAEAGEMVAAVAKVRDSALRATAEYRHDMLKVLARRALTAAYERAVLKVRELEI